MDISREFAANVVRTGFNALDELTVSRARWHILDVIGCAIAGVNAAGCGAMLAVVKKWGGAAESTVLIHGDKVPMPHAAMMNALLARSFDFEPVDAEGIGKSSPAHTSGTTVPTALAVAEYKGASGKDLITALVLGDDIVSRLGVASGFNFEAGWDNTGTINAFGATAIAAKLLGLDEKQLHNAFGIVLNQLGGSMDGVYDKTMAFKLPIAFSARNGIFSALLAKEGFGGVKEPFTGAHGFFHNYCKNADLSDIVKDLGRRFFADTVIKPYSACRGTHSSIDSALKIAGAHEYKPEDIEKIEVNITPAQLAGFCGQPLDFGETPQVDATFSIRYTVARALLDKEIKPDYMVEGAVRDPAVAALVSKMSLVPSIPNERGQATEIKVTMKSGEVFSAATDFPKGHYLKTPHTDDEIKTKFRNNIAYSKTVSPKKAEKALELVLKLEELKDVRELVKLLVK
jgi:2-methylcitrate dehydratase PrpD